MTIDGSKFQVPTDQLLPRRLLLLDFWLTSQPQNSTVIPVIPVCSYSGVLCPGTRPRSLSFLVGLLPSLTAQARRLLFLVAVRCLFHSKSFFDAALVYDGILGIGSEDLTFNTRTNPATYPNGKCYGVFTPIAE
ncbi:hypothetical protein BDR07DRAFT_1385964 [Suillus spraguei]|nr:hypothetical protein BDR07DRAFT_1385964 [Suillus spraguei]